MYDTVRFAETGRTHRAMPRHRGTVGPVVAACGRRAAERDAWTAGPDVDCRACLNRIRCARGHDDCRTRDICERIAMAPVAVPTLVDVAGHRPGTRVLLADGRTPEIRGAMFHASTVTLLYTAGPSDTYPRGTLVDILA